MQIDYRKCARINARLNSDGSLECEWIGNTKAPVAIDKRTINSGLYKQYPWPLLPLGIDEVSGVMCYCIRTDVGLPQRRYWWRLHSFVFTNAWRARAHALSWMQSIGLITIIPDFAAPMGARVKWGRS